MIGNKKHFVVAGATGLIGTSLVEQLITNEEVAKITLLVRKATGVSNPKLSEKVIDFDLFSEKDIPQNVDAVFCCLGTTLKRAGSKGAFKRVDFDYVVKLAVFTQRLKIAQFHVVSAAGANPKGTIYYSRVKGNMQLELQKLDKLKSIFVYQPSMLLGDRDEFRLMESVGKFFMKAFGFLIPKSSKAIYDWQVAQSMIHFAFKPQKGYNEIGNAAMLDLTS